MPHAAVQTLDADAFFALSLPDARSELVRGEVVRMTPAGGEHGVIALRIGARLLAFVEARDLGAVCAAETGFLVTRDPDTVRAPGAAFVSRERMAGEPPPRRFWPFAPDLAVEVVSPSERAEEVQERVRDWSAGGVRRLWLVYPGLRDRARLPLACRGPDPEARGDAGGRGRAAGLHLPGRRDLPLTPLSRFF
jgi:Uma2 family endonuclease